MVINDEKNEVANKSVANALKHVKEKYPNALGQVYIAPVKGNDAKAANDVICAIWKNALLAGDDKVPDFVLDTTTYGPAAEAVNQFTALVGIPTLSAQFGQEGDLLGWRDIKDGQKSM